MQPLQVKGKDSLEKQKQHQITYFLWEIHFK